MALPAVDVAWCAAVRRVSQTSGLDPCFDAGEDGEVNRHVLEAMAGGRSLGAIARELATRFPGRFSMFKETLDHVADLSVRYKS